MKEVVITHALEARLLFPDGVERHVSLMVTEKKNVLVRVKTTTKKKPKVERWVFQAEALMMISEAFNELTNHPEKWRSK